MNWQRIYEDLDAISRTRALTLAESRKLERAIKEIDNAKAGTRDTWTSEQERRLVALVKSGVSISEAGRMMGKTRSAAIGKWGRLAGVIA